MSYNKIKIFNKAFRILKKDNIKFKRNHKTYSYLILNNMIQPLREKKKKSLNI